MFKAIVYDDGHTSEVIEEFSDEKELTVVQKALNLVRYLRSSGKQAVGRFTFTLTKECI